MFVVSAPDELQSIIQEVKYRSALQSAKLIRQLRRRDRLHRKLQKSNDVVTACLQAVSQKRRKITLSVSFNNRLDKCCLYSPPYTFIESFQRNMTNLKNPI